MILVIINKAKNVLPDIILKVKKASGKIAKN